MEKMAAGSPKIKDISEIIVNLDYTKEYQGGTKCNLS